MVDHPALGAMSDLPEAYVKGLASRSLIPLWPALRNALPYNQPIRATVPHIWRYAEVRPDLLRAGELTPIEKAERRVLVLSNPGIGLEQMMATPTIYIGMQLIMPGETAPNHRHSPSAIRFVIEGDGAYTMVDGEKAPMEKGDLILTPSGMWHEHGHEGKNPVVWMDALDLPVLLKLESSYAVEGPAQKPSNLPDRSQTAYRRAGLLPYSSIGQAKPKYPLIRFPWKEVRAALHDLASTADAEDPVHLAYVNPHTGEECLPILGFSAQMLRAGEEVSPPLRSCSSVIHVIEGEGESEIDGKTMKWTQSDTIAIPTYAKVRHRAGSKPAYIFHVDDAPLQRKIGVYEDSAGGLLTTRA